MRNKVLYTALTLQGVTIVVLISILFFTPASVETGSRDPSGAATPPRTNETDVQIARLNRETLANVYIKGLGLEIGALHFPTKVPPTADVKYVDILTNEQLAKHYPEVPADQMVPVDIVDDGQYLHKVDDGTQDFVIANHFLEHCDNPLAAVENMLRVLKPGGILFMAVPDKRYTFDADRPVTSFEHVLRDYREEPEWSRRQHFEEWVTMVNKVQGKDQVEAQVHRLMSMNYSIHYHVWRQVDVNELLTRAIKELDFPFSIELVYRSYERDREVVFILEKTS